MHDDDIRDHLGMLRLAYDTHGRSGNRQEWGQQSSRRPNDRQVGVTDQAQVGTTRSLYSCAALSTSSTRLLEV